MQRKVRTEQYTISEAKPVVVKGVWKFYFSYYTKEGERKQLYQSTGIKLEKSKSRSKNPKVPAEVEAMREKLVRPMVDAANLELTGGASSIDSFFVWLDRYREKRLKSSILSATTKKGDESRYHGIKSYKKLDKPISKITRDDIVDFLDHLRDDKGLSGSTVQQYKLIIDGTFEMAEDKDAILKNPTHKISSYKKNNGKVSSDNVIHPDKLFDFLHEIEGEYIYPCVLMALCAGLRRSECIGLRWDKVNIPGLMGCKEIPGIEYGSIEVSQKIINIGPNDDPKKSEHLDGMLEYFKIENYMKNDSSKRKVIIVEEKMKNLICELFNTQQALRHICADGWNRKWGGTPCESNISPDENEKYREIWRNGHPDYGYVCINDTGELITPGQVEDHWKRLKKKYPEYIGNVSFHGLRHSYATYLIHHQYSLLSVSRQLGHSSVMVTDNFYIHNDTGDLIKAKSENSTKKKEEPKNDKSIFTDIDGNELEFEEIDLGNVNFF